MMVIIIIMMTITVEGSIPVIHSWVSGAVTRREAYAV